MAEYSFTGAFNASTLSVPDVYLNIQPPGQGIIRPASFGFVGLVGVASWGPKGVSTLVGSIAQLALFGSGPVVRTYDLVTHATIILLQQMAAGVGANLIVVRQTDGSDTAATGNLGGAQGLTLTSIYTGSAANAAVASIAAGSKNGTWKLTLQHPGFQAEIFDNVGFGITGNAVWVALANAVNNGASSLRGPSQIMVASAGNSSSAPAASSVTLAGGADGAGSITPSNLIGSDTAGARTGIYGFRNSGVSDLVIADLSDITQEPNLTAFGQAEGIYCHTSGPAGETVAAGVTNRNTQGTDNAWVKRWLGDWCYWFDNYNGQQRFIAPATFGAGLMSTLQPQQDSLNKQIVGLVATQRSKSGVPYGNDEISTIVGNGLDVICNPIPRGNMFGVRVGQNSSSDGTRNGDNWPRLTSFLARSLAGPGALGTLIGEPITADFFRKGYDMLDAFCSGLVNSGTVQAYQITFDRSNNPQIQTAAGLVIARVLIQYFGIARVFLVNMQTGQTVVIPSNTNTGATAAG